ncbi:MAG: ABC transporter substrate-binding protein [Candidatus Hermodarchaeota archaeon]
MKRLKEVIKKLLVAVKLVGLLLLMTLPVPILSLEQKQTILYSSNHWREETAWINEIIYKIVPASDQFEAIINGSVDIIDTTLFSWDIPSSIFDNSDIEYNITHRHGFFCVFFNTHNWPTNNTHFRRALAFAVDKIGMIEKTRDAYVSGGEKNPADELWLEQGAIDSIVAESFGIWSLENPAAIDRFPYNYTRSDLVRGNHSLLLGGFYDINDDGWREWWNTTKSGIAWEDAVNVTMFTPDIESPNSTIANEGGYNASFFMPGYLIDLNNETNWEQVTFKHMVQDTGDPRIVSAAQSIGEAFNSTGILVDILQVDTLVASEMLFNGSWFAFSTDLDFYYDGLDSLLRYTSKDPVLLQDDPFYWWYPEFTGWSSNTTYDAYIDQIRHSPDFDTVLNASYEAQKILAYELPLIPFYDYFYYSFYRVDEFMGWIQSTNSIMASSLTLVTVRLTSNVPGGNLIYAIEEDIVTLNPLNLSSPYAIQRSQYEQWSPLSLIYDTLWMQDPAGMPVPWLADDWDINVVNNDNLNEIVDSLAPPTGITPVLKITFSLNPNFKWHDNGQPVTPEDVKFSFQLYEDTKSPVFYRFTKAGGGYIDPERIIVNNNAGTVTFIIESTSYFDFFDTGLPILPKHIWENITNPLSYNNAHPIGSGPYKWDSRILGEHITLVRNPDWPFSPEKTSTTTVPIPSNSTLPTAVASSFELLVTVIAMFSLACLAVLIHRRRLQH